VSAKLIRDIEEGNKNVSVIVAVIDQARAGEMSGARICYLHRKKLAGTAGFQVRLLNSAMLDERLHAF
jgi:hypothetical protein